MNVTSAAPRDTGRLIGFIGLVLAIAYAVLLIGALMQGQWLIDADGNPVSSAFVGLWSAGKAVLEGDAASVYDWATESRLEAVATGYALGSFYPWFYPPPLLFVAAAFASLPVIPASVAWFAVTTPLYAAAIWGILKRPMAVLLALGFPGALLNVSAGQSGFLTAAALGGALALMERRPILAGICLGHLICKPQFAILFPFVLLATCRWRVFVSAAVTALAVATISLVVFGPEVWTAFWQAVPASNKLNFDLGGAGWDKWQSLFGTARALGANAMLAWILQGIVAAAVTIVVIAIWRSDKPFDLKAGALAAGALIVTPEFLIHDLAALAVPVAFLLRYDLVRGFPRVDIAGIVAVIIILLLAYLIPAGAEGIVATAMVFALILRHAFLPTAAPQTAAVR